VKVAPEVDDAPDFIRYVERRVNGVSRRHGPDTIALIKAIGLIPTGLGSPGRHPGR